MSIFTEVKASKPKKNAFNLSHDVKFSFKFGQLIPVLVQETLPGDIFKGKSQSLIRVAPMIAPIMHNINVYCHYFFVPNRIIWENWEEFITGAYGVQEIDIIPPFIRPTNEQVANGTLADYMGLPSSDLDNISYREESPYYPANDFNALPFAAYQRVWYEYYRDQNIEFFQGDHRPSLTDGFNSYNITDTETTDVHLGTLRYRAWTKDYFASALPWAQKGPAATIPVGFTGDIEPKPGPWGGLYTYARDPGSGDVIPVPGANNYIGLPSGVPSGQVFVRRNSTGAPGASNPAVFLDSSMGYQLETDGSGTIEDLRRAFKIQNWLERNAGGGTRYVESILSHFGERVRDYRLDRPHYIGGSKNRIQISEVLQTSETTETGTPQGDMAGHGISAGYSGKYNYKCQEHGWIIGIMSITPTPAYFQGVDRKYGARKDRLDYFWPSFANLGEQAIQNKELFYTGATEPDAELAEETFGYTPRYAEYRTALSRVAGDFNTSLSYWHLARKFATVPQLNRSFLRVGYDDFSDLDRIFAVQDGTDYFWAHTYHDIKAIRPLPRYATPF